MSKLFRAVAYPRYSSDNQREESISAQMDAITDYCKHKGYVLVNSYPDEAKTATSDNRPNFQKMIADSAKGLFDVIIVHKLDRFARDRYDSAHYKRILKKNGVKLESVLEQFDDSPESVILESVLEGMAEYYSKNLAREARKGMLVNAKKGIHAGGRAPYGLQVNPETRLLEINPNTYKAVQIYFEGIDSGLSLQQIADKLNILGYKTQEGRAFTKNSFANWASNRKYRGDYTWDVTISKSQGITRSNRKRPSDKQILIEGIVPAIIEPDLWDRVNKMMEDRKKKSGKHKANIIYLLSGKIKCGQCGGVYVGNSYRNPKSKDNNLLMYYRCNCKCGNSSIRKDELENIVADKLSNVCFTDASIQQIADNVIEMYKKEKSNVQTDMQPIKKELKQLQSKIDNWVESIGLGIKSVVEKIKEAEHRMSVLEHELNRLELLNSTPSIDREKIVSFIHNQKQMLFSSKEEDKKRVLQEYVDLIVIQPSKSLDNFEAEVTYRVFNGGGEGI